MGQLIGRLVYEARRAKGYTQLETGKLAHLSQIYISEIEHGKRGDASPGTLQSVAKVLGIGLDDMREAYVSDARNEALRQWQRSETHHDALIATD